MLNSKDKRVMPVNDADVVAEVTAASLRGETLTRSEAVQRIRQRYEDDRRTLGWYEALRRHRERREHGF